MSEGKINKIIKGKGNDNPWLMWCRRCGGETEHRDVKELIDNRGSAVIKVFKVCTVPKCGQINGRRWESGEGEVKKAEEKILLNKESAHKELSGYSTSSPKSKK